MWWSAICCAEITLVAMKQKIGGNRRHQGAQSGNSHWGQKGGEGCWDSGERNRLEMELKDGLEKTHGWV